MSSNRLILGLYLDPHVWISLDNETIEPLKLTPSECLHIVFHRVLSNGIEVAIQRQGFLIVSFPEEVLEIKTDKINTANLLPIKATQRSLSFFNALLFLIYNETFRHHNGKFQSIKQHAHIANLWRWTMDGAHTVYDCSIKQPIPILQQDEMIKVDTALYWMRKTVGYLSENDRLMRSNLPVTVLEGAINLLVQLKDPFVDWQLLALLNKAAYGIQRAEFAESLTLSWSVAETIIEFEWVNYIESTNQSIDAQKRKPLILSGDVD